MGVRPMARLTACAYGLRAASHLFEEPAALVNVTALAARWFNAPLTDALLSTP